MIALALCFMVVAVDLTPAMAVTKAQIDALKTDASGLKKQKTELQSKIKQLSDDISNTMKKKELLDSEISVLTSEISNVEQQIEMYEQLMEQTQAELEDAQEQEAAQYELFCRRVRAMEEEGTVSYWSVLFKADSFSDLLSRLDIINEIMDSDQRVIARLQALQEEIAAKQADLAQQKAESEEVRADLVTKKSDLNKRRDEANALVVKLRASQGELQEDMDDLSAEEASIQAQIVKLSKQLAAEEAARAAAAAAAAAAQNKPVASNVALGGYIWPVSSHYVTSTFGGRASPGGIGSTNHKGIDIGQVGYTTKVCAAKAGTVIISQYSSSYGNYVVVSHGSGNTTLYAHMSSRKVSAGQTVKQGAVLGITGSTGNSTGPHLHFEITENGVRINPLKYLTNYTKAG